MDVFSALDKITKCFLTFIEIVTDNCVFWNVLVCTLQFLHGFCNQYAKAGKHVKKLAMCWLQYSVFVNRNANISIEIFLKSWQKQMKRNLVEVKYTGYIFSCYSTCCIFHFFLKQDSKLSLCWFSSYPPYFFFHNQYFEKSQGSLIILQSIMSFYLFAFELPSLPSRW